MVVKITGEFIKLGQFLKKINEIDTGGQARTFLKTNDVKINGKVPEGRASKIKPGDIVWVNDLLIKIEQDPDSESEAEADDEEEEDEEK